MEFTFFVAQWYCIFMGFYYFLFPGDNSTIIHSILFFSISILFCACRILQKVDELGNNTCHYYPDEERKNQSDVFNPEDPW